MTKSLKTALLLIIIIIIEEDFVSMQNNYLSDHYGSKIMTIIITI